MTKMGNAIKYLWRAGLKGEENKRVQDLEKAAWYVDREEKRVGPSKALGPWEEFHIKTETLVRIAEHYSFHIGSAMHLIWLSESKGSLKLEAASWHLDREVRRLDPKMARPAKFCELHHARLVKAPDEGGCGCGRVLMRAWGRS